VPKIVSRFWDDFDYALFQVGFENSRRFSASVLALDFEN
jgi:hypothetical protein